MGVYSYGDFDATTIISDSVIFAGAGPISFNVEDINEDGIPDVVFHFLTQSLNLQLGEARACLSGALTTDDTFRSCDSVNVV